MNRFPATLIGILLFLIITGCKGKEFDIEITLPENIEVNFDTYYYADSKEGGMIVQGVAPVISGKCLFKGVTLLPTLLFLKNKSFPVPVVIYIERGDHIKIEGESENPYLWKVGGNKINDRLSEWRNKNSKTLENNEPKAINRAVADYVNKNPDDPVSTILLLTVFDRYTEEVLYNSLWKKLKEDAKDEKWTTLIGRVDQLTKAPSPAPSSVRSIVARSSTKGLDTIHPDGVKGSFIVFWNSATPDRSVISDSLRKLIKDYPDSSSRLITDIYIEPDSLGWRNQIRNDTIKKMARLWIPAGFADPEVMKLGVRYSTFFIVADSLGRQAYRGTNLDSALLKFRKIIRN